jgi:hypothetical protein
MMNAATRNVVEEARHIEVTRQDGSYDIRGVKLARLARYRAHHLPDRRSIVYVNRDNSPCREEYLSISLHYGPFSFIEQLLYIAHDKSIISLRPILSKSNTHPFVLIEQRDICFLGFYYIVI